MRVNAGRVTGTCSSAGQPLTQQPCCSAHDALQRESRRTAVVRFAFHPVVGWDVYAVEIHCRMQSVLVRLPRTISKRLGLAAAVSEGEGAERCSHNIKPGKLPTSGNCKPIALQGTHLNHLPVSLLMPPRGGHQQPGEPSATTK